MSAGRTYWLALDARWLAREGVVEAREEAGHAAVTVLLALMGQAKLENDGGKVTTGYRALAREAFLDGGQEEASRIVTLCHAAGLLDDFEEHEDGKRFSCRLSGWVADQTKGRAADRKAAGRRDEEDPGSEDGKPPFAGGMHDEEESDAGVTDGDLSRPVTHGHVPVGRGQDSTGENISTSSSVSAEPDPEILRLCHLLADLILARDPKARVAPTSKGWVTDMDRLVRLDGRSVEEVERIIRWAQADSFWQSNILSAGKLREKFTALAAKAPRHLTAIGAVPALGEPGYVDPMALKRAQRQIENGFVDSKAAETLRAAGVAFDETLTRGVS